jgi:hypothetical protein
MISTIRHRIVSAGMREYTMVRKDRIVQDLARLVADRAEKRPRGESTSEKIAIALPVSERNRAQMPEKSNRYVGVAFNPLKQVHQSRLVARIKFR